MSLFSSCKRGKLDGVKAALSRGEMEALSCGEKLKCVNAALQTKKNGALMEALMEHLDLDSLLPVCLRSQIGDDAANSFLQKKVSLSFLSFHSNCVQRALASGNLNGQYGKLFKPGDLLPEALPDLSEEELGQRIRETISLTQDCVPNTRTLVQLYLAMKEAVKGHESKRKLIKEENEKEGSKNLSLEEKKSSREQQREEETAAPRKESNSKKRKNKDKKRKPATACDNVSNEKVKAELRSQISDLELEEEKGKQALASTVEKKNTSIVVLESDLKEVLEEKINLQEEMRDVDAAIESLMARKKCIAEKQDRMEKEAEKMNNRIQELEDSANLIVKQQTEKLEKVQADLEKAHKELDLFEGRKTMNSNLEKFLTREIEELRGQLECPVCLEVVTKAPIYKCDDDHLICRYLSSS